MQANPLSGPTPQRRTYSRAHYEQETDLLKDDMGRAVRILLHGATTTAELTALVQRLGREFATVEMRSILWAEQVAKQRQLDRQRYN